MSVTFACIAGEEIHRQWEAGRLSGRELGRHQTPFGLSGEVFLIDTGPASFYLLSRHGSGVAKSAPHRVNYRANLYALKDLGVDAVLAWGSGGAITHNIAIGDLVVLDDIIDQTHLRPKTFFEDSPLGYVRQFPVFCPSLRRICSEALHAMKLVYHGAGTAAVREGPRFETPAEVRMLTAIGAEMVTHAFAPEVFLAKELELCYAAVCYAVDYAETGSRHRPFIPGALFGGMGEKSDSERVAGTVGAMSQIVSAVAVAAQSSERVCECPSTMASHVRDYGLSRDWRTWFTPPSP
jgi:5'-methylthioinosine phosphorylase